MDPLLAKFASVLRGALEAKGITLSMLRDRLAEHGNPMSFAALSYWRNGQRKPEGAKSLAAVEDIERILGLAAGSLLSLIGPSARGGSRAPRFFPEGVEPIAAAFDDMAATLMSDSITSAREVSTHIIADLDEHGCVARQSIRIRIQAVEDRVTEFAWVEAPLEPSPISPIFTARAGCRLDRELAQPAGEGFAALFALDRTIAVGETTMIEFQMDFPPGYPRARACEHLTSRRTKELVLWVRFDGSPLPDWIEETQLVDGVRTQRARLLDGVSVHAERTGFPPGLLSLQWGYDDSLPQG